MTLNFWGWDGDQYTAAAYLKPNPDDKNVMPDEIERFVQEKTKYGILVRTGGTLDDLRSLIAGGFPVIIEKGLTVTEQDMGWMGHYDFITGYFDDKRSFLTQDAYRGRELYGRLRFPHVRLARVRFRLSGGLSQGPGAGSNRHSRTQRRSERPIRPNTLALAILDTQTVQGQSLAFAYFNLGSAHVGRTEYADAASAYDMARYLGLPWRFLWYQIGPYLAYYYTGRYQDVIDLANATLNVQENLEESWYWRGMARMQLGDRPGAVADWREAVKKHPGYAPALDQLSQLGERP